MTQPEALAWMEFYKLYPFDDYTRFHRPAALIARAGFAGFEIEDSLQWLQPSPQTFTMSEADMNSLKAFGVTPPR